MFHDTTPNSYQPFSNTLLDRENRPIEAALYRRRYGMKNRERLNRLLLLLQLEEVVPAAVDLR